MKVKQIIFLLFCCFSTTLFGQQVWRLKTADFDGTALQKNVQQFQIAQLDTDAFEELLFSVPKERFQRPVYQRIYMPMPDASLAAFDLVELDVMEAGLAEKYPHFKTYRGYAVDNPSTSLRLTWTHRGIDATIFSAKGDILIRSLEQKSDCIIYFGKHEIGGNMPADLCGFSDKINHDTPQNPLAATTDLRIIRTAVATTGEYTEERGGGVENGLASVVTVVNTINGIYERDFGIRLILVENNDQIIYGDAATDPYETSAFALLSQNRENLNTVIGRENYDLGHILGFNIEGGVAGVASFVGNFCTEQTASGVSGYFGNQTRFIRTVAHEMGHQLGADHTWSNCGEDLNDSQRSSNTAMEPGSGNTIMSYAGSCGENNVKNIAEKFFHGVSIQQVNAHLDNTGQCYQLMPTGNTAPIVKVNIDNGFNIPVSTPFELEASASDVDDDQLTYSWEQFDIDTISSLGFPIGDGPSFRVFAPDTFNMRVLPNRITIQLAREDDTEVLPTYDRNYKFNVIVRDNFDGGGSVTQESVAFAASTAAGPFQLIFPNDRETTLTEGQQVEVVWDVANTTADPINCEAVDIMLSYNNGFSYADTLAHDAPNFGSAFVTIPFGQTTNRARIKVKAANNVFFDISDDIFTIAEGAVAVKETEADSPLQVMPNPAQDKLWIRLENGTQTSTQLQVFDAQGKLIQSERFQNFTHAQVMDISSLKSGIYFLKAVQDGKQYVRRIAVY